MTTFSLLLALLNIATAFFYIASSITLLIKRHPTSSAALFLYITQLLAAPSILQLAGAMMFFQGWRISPLLLLSFFLLNALIIFLGVRELLLLRNL